MASPASTAKKKAASKRTQPKKKQSAARQWKRAKAEEIEVPSGNVALVKRPGMEVFLLEGLLPDSLMPIVTEAINTGKGLPPEKVKAMGEDLNAVSGILDTMDRVTARICVEPKVLWHKRPKMDGEGNPVLESYTEDDVVKSRQALEAIPENERVDEDGVLYTDDIDFDDKTFLFQYAVGGTRDLEQFRLESESAMASLPTGDDVPETS